MKQAETWDEHDLLLMIENKQEESYELDFKRADSLRLSIDTGNMAERKKEEISKDVSAFANYAGGTIIYGIEESPSSPHYAKAFSPVDPKQASKDWLDQVINARIQPRISGVVINAVELKKNHSGKFAYVVCVPESTTAHQASDKKYYKRFNFQSVAMEDYEVRYTMNRATRPAYSLSLEPGNINSQGGQTSFRFRCTLENRSEIVAHDVSAVIFVPRDLVRQPDSYVVDVQGLPYTRIAGNFVEASRVLRTAVEAAHPFATYAIGFEQSVGWSQLPVERRFTVYVRVYDQFGLAWDGSFYVEFESLKIELKKQKHLSKRDASKLSLDQ